METAKKFQKIAKIEDFCFLRKIANLGTPLKDTFDVSRNLSSYPSHKENIFGVQGYWMLPFIQPINNKL